ncbi:MAG TPA: LamG-like jellyroll fold domain-containing protein [Pedobacter sp.]|uniref:LamG-like jellyroll fold domain-containing protein n=1 Tax=Pedobacter sp. TaxID=1411316 RepID=UPI002CBEFD31|nr:LamG-like jellyroll fold domain-containing protein [Pedobacter sp.]HMI03178.1 LamG-like jellyroll fold domain-containing protein [Pedobacter sp.]
MKAMLFTIVALWLCFVHDACAQEWLNGYSYRKKITVNKSKVQAIEISTGTSVLKQDLPNFPVLIEIQDDDLIHVPGVCGNKMRNAEGRDISFALSGTPSVPLSFQLENYDPARGKLTCWVRISSLSANGTSTAATSFYLYYGSALLHDPFGPGGISVWSGDFSRVWHLKCDVPPATSKDAQSPGITAQNATGSAGVDGTNFINSKIGTGIRLEGSAGSFYSGADTSSNITVSAWINLKATGTEQVIIANDSVNGRFRNGYVFKVNAGGKLVMELYRSMTAYAVTSSAILDPNKWYHAIALISGTQISLILNGSKVGGRTDVTLGNGGSICIGSSKQNNGYYSGSIDELRIQKTAKPMEWLKTQYVNQDSPSLFFTVFEEEYNPSEFSKFIGPSGGSWMLPANWSNGSIPAPGSNVVVPSGKSVRISGSSPVAVNTLIVKAGAQLQLSNDLEINCTVQTDIGAAIKLDDQIVLKCSGNIINNGNISINHATGTLVFSGRNGTQLFSGNGTASIHRLENEQALINSELILNAQIRVSGDVSLKRGVLNCNGNLTLLADDKSGSASILPVPLNDARIIGYVNVQQYISGNYPAPATARNWRLLTSPVYSDTTSGSKYYNISAFRNAMFITGPGGISNGFDASPLNSGTIYLHDQSLSGNLSQKYTPINDINVKIALGKGIYVFSRGPRTAPGAYLNQIQQSPFSNPEGYYLTHTGKVYSGDLSFRLDNKNSGAEGDGFNLLGNPYPASLLWGNIIKVNLSPYVWQYDPLNRDYVVSEAPDTRIPLGTGFFVKVISGQSSGSITFSESAKAIATETAASNPAAFSQFKPGSKLSYVNVHSQISSRGQLNMTALVSRKAFSQQYRLNFDANGNDDLDDDDAIKLGEGYVNIASVIGNSRLAIEQRSASKDIQKIDLYVTGWESGTYTIDFKASAALRKAKAITVTDNYLKQEITLQDSIASYAFKIDTKIQATQGNRFVITLKSYNQNERSANNRDDIIIYPNPVSNRLYFKSVNKNIKNARVTFTDLTGKAVAAHKIDWTLTEPSIDCSNISRGLYLMKMYEQESHKIIKTFKVVKE